MQSPLSISGRRILLGLGATVILVGGAVGVAAAHQTPPSPGTSGQQQHQAVEERQAEAETHARRSARKM